jgi:chromosome segregation ATPase
MKLWTGLLAFLLVALTWYSLNNRQKMNERIDILEVELTARQAYVDELQDSLDVRREYTDSVVARMDTLISNAEAAAKLARDSANALGGRLHEYIGELDLSDQQKTYLRLSLTELQDRYSRVIVEKDEIIEAQLTQINALSDELQLALRVNDELHQTLGTAEDLLDEYRHALNPGFVGWLTRDVPEKIALIGAGALIGVIAAN